MQRLNSKPTKRKRFPTKTIKFIKSLKFLIKLSETGEVGLKLVSVNGGKRFTIPEAQMIVKKQMKKVREYYDCSAWTGYPCVSQSRSIV